MGSWKLVALGLCLVFLSSCTASTGMNKAQTGALGGAAAGAIAGQAIGKNTKGTLIGAGAGMLLGYVLGNELDKYDQQQASRVYETAPSGTKVAWVNPDSGRRVEMVPGPAYSEPAPASRGAQRTCRTATMLVYIDGKPEEMQQKACRDDYTGQWVAAE